MEKGLVMNVNLVYLLLMGGGFVFGWASSNFVYGRKVCHDCWLALVKGRRDENGCETCMNWLANERVH